MYTRLRRGLKQRAADLADLYPARPAPLAEPPAGSGLLPVLGDGGAPLLGHSLRVYHDPIIWARKAFDKYGEVSWTSVFGRRAVAVFGPDALEVVWSNKDKVFSSEQGWEYWIGPFFRRGIMLLDFDEHLHHRRIMQQAFTRPRLIGYLDMMHPGIDRELTSWQPEPGFLVYDHIKQMLLNLATEVFVGAELGPEAKEVEHAFEATVVGGQALIRTPVPGGTWDRGLRGRRLLQQYFRDQLPAKRAGNGTDLFSVLCRATSDTGDTFGDEDIVNHMIFVLMAAHDTSAVSLSMLTYLLGKNPHWQERLRAESLALGKDFLEYDDLDKLTSLDLAFKETLRMYAPAGVLMRQAVRDTDILGHYVPAGTDIIIGAYPSMRLSRWWPRPDEFDPERFADDRREDKIHRYAWSPFGGGAHKCIGLHFGGMTVKSIMHRMLLQYEWSVPENYEVPLAWGTGPTPEDGLPINLRPRYSRSPEQG
ncbi:cytochrome P450 [Nocardia shimofusensis]|uniref:cytochrome P450 n=1 Tax=Nocardia shimofusensis TaxID=228596 RepID=UPI0008352D59|nr:cytochrome P450 [Nocardia shimofusensis]